MARCLNLAVAALLSAAVAATAQDAGDAAESKPADQKPSAAATPELTEAELFGEGLVVIRGARVITVSGDELAAADVVIEDGEITLVGVGLDFPTSAEVIEARGMTVMPGMILVGTRHGLPGYSRRGVNAQRTVQGEVYWDLIDTQPLLESGFTSAVYDPAGGGIPGAGSLYRLAGPNEIRRIEARAYVRAIVDNLPADKKTLRGAIERARSEIEKVNKAREEFEKQQAEKKKQAAQQEAQKPAPEEGEQSEPESENGGAEPAAPAPEEEKFTPPAIDPAHKPLVDLINGVEGAPRLLVEVGSAGDWLHATEVLAAEPDIAHDFSFRALAGDISFAAEKIAGAGEDAESDEDTDPVRIVLPAGLTAMPNTIVTFHAAAVLDRLGAELTFKPWADVDRWFRRYRTALADMTRFGLDRESALAGATLNPAKLLGVDDRFGSVEKGKRADLVFYDGDPLNPVSRVKMVMIEGEVVWTDSEEAR